MTSIGHVMRPVEADPKWRELAACRGTDPDLFFPERGDFNGHMAAIKVCNTCPVIEQCLQYALDANELDGVYGGKSGRERRRIRRATGGRKPAACGTDSGYFRHIRKFNEEPCQACKTAHTEIQKVRNARRMRSA